MRTTIIIVDAEIEPIPRERSLGSKLKSTSEEVFGEGDVILDSWLHADILKYTPGGNRRGRPDIIHHALSLCLGSLAYRHGLIDVIVHTRNNDVIRFGRKVEVPQNYFEFLHLLGKLYADGHYGSGEELITIEGISGLEELLNVEGAEVTLVMTPHGEYKGLEPLLPGFQRSKVAIVFGGFSEGEYRSPAYDLSEITVSLGPEILNINAVTSEILRCLPK
jgi:rRNA small subunit pseudouridine methyltransferase Nep1